MIDVGLFLEDDGHRAFLAPLCRRLADGEGCEIRLHERSASGGIGVTLRQLRQYVRDLRDGVEQFMQVLIVAVDGNCQGFNERRKLIEQVVGDRYPGQLVIAVPDPHVELWYLADPDAPGRALGRAVPVQVPTYKCERARYKTLLREVFSAVGIQAPAGGIEFGDDIVAELDLDRACRNDRAFARLVGDYRAALRRLAPGGA
ncbi:MAG: hypothetical protein ACRD0K_08915 [Egibacteraceae bacterium]